MIICAEGYDYVTRRSSIPIYPIVINTEHVLYARGRDNEGKSTIVYLRHNATKEGDNGTPGEPIWLVIDMPTKDFYEKWKEAEDRGGA